ncbi:MAG: DUF2250 domain-containing protein [Candidatus Hydrothermarchaeota archaeon]|nr:MAG: DUF2250 domain-containing protein [Candidatus Hydrothermarchaeota archaeon]
MNNLSPLHIYILAHLSKANIDYAKSIAKVLKTEQSIVDQALKELEDIKIIERSHGSSIKRTKARFKLSHEVHKHHTYYKLTKEGELLLREIKKDFSAYLTDLVENEKTLEILKFLRKAKHEHVKQIAKVFSLQIDEAKSIITKLLSFGLIAECKTKLLKRKHRRAKPKKETRTQHKYYKLSRLGELLLRFFC